MTLPTSQEENGEWITIRTTLPIAPLPPLDTRPSLRTERLLLRPLTMDDLEEAYSLRTQPEVMIHTTAARIDNNLGETRKRLELYTPPNDAYSYNYAICVPSDKGRLDGYEMIGIGGLHRFRFGPFGWPEIGYMIKHEYWGNGITTEFLKGYMKLYCDLPRTPEPVPLRVDMQSVPDWNGEEGALVEEKAIAITVDYNNRSHRVLQKSGFEEYFQADEPDLRDPSKRVILRVFQYLPGAVIQKQKEGDNAAK